MGNKKKHPPFSKMVLEALSTADNPDGLNAKMILDIIKQYHSIEDSKANLDFVYQELGHGKESGQFLQVKGDSVHGFFKFNPDYVPPAECPTNELPDYLNPPTPSTEPVEAPKAPKKRKKRNKKKKKDGAENAEKKKDGSEHMLLRILPNGTVEKGEIDPATGEMKFSVYESMPYLSRAQVARMQNRMPNSMSEEEATKLAHDPLFRRVYTQTKSTCIAPELQKSVDNEALKKSKRLLRGDRTDRIRLGLKSFAHESAKDDEAEAGTSMQEQMSQLEINDQESEEDDVMHPQVEKILKRGLAKKYVDNLKSEDDAVRSDALVRLNRMIHGTEHQRAALLRLGVLTGLIDCINAENLSDTNLATSNLFLLSKKEQDLCTKMLRLGVADKLLTLCKTCRDSEDPMWEAIQVHVPLFTFSIVSNLLNGEYRIECKDYHDIMNLLFEMLQRMIDDAMFPNFFRVTFMFVISYFSENREYLWKYEFDDETLRFFYSKLEENMNTELTDVIIKFFRIIFIRDGERVVPMYAELGLLNRLSELLDNEDREKVECALKCIHHLVDECSDGYKLVCDCEGLVSKVIPFLSSDRTDLRKAGTKVFVSLVDAKYEQMADHMDLVSFFRLARNVSEFELSNDSLRENLYKLGNILKGQAASSLNPIVKRLKRRAARKH